MEEQKESTRERSVAYGVMLINAYLVAFPTRTLETAETASVHAAAMLAQVAANDGNYEPVTAAELTEAWRGDGECMTPKTPLAPRNSKNKSMGWDDLQMRTTATTNDVMKSAFGKFAGEPTKPTCVPRLRSLFRRLRSS